MCEGEKSIGIMLIIMPVSGDGSAEVELFELQFQPGYKDAEDQLLADVMTDKATVQVRSPVNGTVHTLGGKVGEIMAVGSELIRLQVEGPGNVAADGKSSSPPRQEDATPPEAAKPSSNTQVVKPSASSASAAVVSPTALAAARPRGEKPLASPAVRQREIGRASCRERGCQYV